MMLNGKNDRGSWARARKTAVALLSLIVIGAVLGWPRPSHTALQLDTFAGLEPISHMELATLRGGMTHPDLPMGLEISMGGNIRTMVDGTTILETVFSVVDNMLTAVHDITENGPSFNGVQFVGSAEDVAEATRGQVNIPDGFVGVALPGANGGTVALHRVDLDQNQIANIVIANDPQHDVVQTLSLDFTIMGIGNLQREIVSVPVRSAVRDAARAAALSALSD